MSPGAFRLAYVTYTFPVLTQTFTTREVLALGELGIDVRVYAYGGSGHDKITGGSGRDYLYGQSGNDRLYGLGGFDQMWGGSGWDSFSGGSGFDIVHDWFYEPVNSTEVILF